ncbi:hypothetical protein NicSoilB8_25010 [Arthrobacter sp. NicSoilB8]|nr:hypothetical protein NicSoilB8_25010 [Arthrobacter sp. NicSoilB8]
MPSGQASSWEYGGNSAGPEGETSSGHSSVVAADIVVLLSEYADVIYVSTNSANWGPGRPIGLPFIGCESRLPVLLSGARSP